MVKADVQCMFKRPQTGYFGQPKARKTLHTSICKNFFHDFALLILNLSIESTDDQSICPLMLGQFSCLPQGQIMSSILDLLSICLVIHVGGKLIRQDKQGQRGMLMEKHFLGHTFSTYTILSHKHCTCALGSELKPTVTHRILITLLDNFFHPNIRVKNMV